MYTACDWLGSPDIPSVLVDNGMLLIQLKDPDICQKAAMKNTVYIISYNWSNSLHSFVQILECQ